MGHKTPSATERRLAAVRALREEFFGEAESTELEPAELAERLHQVEERLQVLERENERIRDQLAAIARRPEAESGQPVGTPPEPSQVEPAFDFYRD